MEDRNKLYTWQTLTLVVGGLIVNYAGAKIALLCKLPIFLDSVGTVLAAAYGGFLPGVTVGFFSNVLNSVGDPITLYYGVISMLIGILAAVFSQKRFFLTVPRTLATVIPFALVGGAVGSVLTWMLSGLSFGSGISSPFVLSIYHALGVSEFTAQLIGDFLIDLLDKLVTVAIVYPVLHLMPQAWVANLPLGHLYLKKPAETPAETEAPKD